MPPSTVLFLAANPARVPPLQLGEECRAIEEMIRAAKFRDRIRFRSWWAARPDDLLQALNEDAPSVLHFSGHGAGDQGLCFQAEDGSALRVSSEGLEQVIRAAGASVTLVVLNACFSEVQARALVAHVPCVIGMSEAIGDEAAIDYARALYRALAFGRSVANAHQQGLAALALRPASGQARDVGSAGASPRSTVPQLLTRLDTDPDRVHIVALVEKRHCEIRIRATLKAFNAEVIARVTEELREITGDLSLEIVDLNEGSVRLKISLAPAALERLLKLRADDQLNELCGFEVSAVTGLPEEAEGKAPAPAPERDKPGFPHAIAQAAAGAPEGPHSFEDELAARRAKQRFSEDEHVLSMLAKGDRRGAVDAMMEMHEERVFAYCVHMLRDRVLAEDVAQQVFTEAYRDLDRCLDKPSLRAWLVGIAHHRCGDALKARARRHARIALDLEAVTDHVDPGLAPPLGLDRERWAAALADCLNQLSIDVREAVILRFLDDMTYEEMAAVLGRDAHTLAVRVGRALPLLKRCLERKGWKPE